MSQGSLDVAQFSFMLKSNGAELFLGGMNAANYVAGSTQWTNVTEQSYWTVSATAKVSGTAVLSDLKAVVDSGTSIIVVSSSAPSGPQLQGLVLIQLGSPGPPRRCCNVLGIRPWVTALWRRLLLFPVRLRPRNQLRLCGKRSRVGD